MFHKAMLEQKAITHSVDEESPKLHLTSRERREDQAEYVPCSCQQLHQVFLLMGFLVL